MNSESSPLVSFVVPCYRYAHFLGQCVDSILAQTFRDFELIVMDDCSPDNTAEVMARYTDSRIRYVRQPVNKGGCLNLNEGLQMARGKYVWPLSADDYLARNNALEEYLAMFRQNPELGFIYSRSRCWNEEEKKFESFGGDESHDKVWSPGGFLRVLLGHNRIVSSGVMIRAECSRVTGYWDPSEEIRYCPDWYLYARLALHFGIGYVSEPAVVYRIHRASEIQGYEREQPAMAVEHPTRLRWRILDEAWETGRHHLLRMIAMTQAQSYARRRLPGELTGYRITLSQADLERDARAKGRHEETRALMLQLVSRSLPQAYTDAGAASYLAGRLDLAAAAFRSALAQNSWHLKARLYLALVRVQQSCGINLVAGLKAVKRRLLHPFTR